MGTETREYVYTCLKGLVTATFGSSGPFYMENGCGVLVPSLHRVYRLSNTRTLKYIEAIYVLMTHTEALQPVCHKGNSQL